MIRFILVIGLAFIYLIVTSPVLLVMWILSLLGMNVYGPAFRMTAWILGILLKLSGARLTVRGLENIPEDKAVLVCGNHRSYFDIISTYSILPRTTGYLSKKQMALVPLLGGWLVLSSSVPIDRKNIKKGMKSILECIDHINKGLDVFIFPEGTRAKTDGEFGEFHEASFKIAQRTGCPIIPVTINGTRELFEAHFPRIIPHDVIIDFGKPVAYEKRIGETLRQSMMAVYRENRSLMK